jgi:hypothetical protein
VLIIPHVLKSHEDISSNLVVIWTHGSGRLVDPVKLEAPVSDIWELFVYDLGNNFHPYLPCSPFSKLSLV